MPDSLHANCFVCKLNNTILLPIKKGMRPCRIVYVMCKKDVNGEVFFTKNNFGLVA